MAGPSKSLSDRRSLCPSRKAAFSLVGKMGGRRLEPRNWVGPSWSRSGSQVSLQSWKEKTWGLELLERYYVFSTTTPCPRLASGWMQLHLYELPVGQIVETIPFPSRLLFIHIQIQLFEINLPLNKSYDVRVTKHSNYD